jgi:hypothetical protein
MDWCGFDGRGMVGSSVENATFGAGKVLVELDFIRQMYEKKGPVLESIMWDLIKAAKVEGDRVFLSDRYTDLRRHGGNPDRISDQVLYYLLFTNLSSTCDIVLNFNEGRNKKVNKALAAMGALPENLKHTVIIPESLDGDIVVNLCRARKPELEAWKAQNRNGSLEVLVAKYIEVKKEILEYIAICHPAIAKLGAGRGAIFPFIIQKWENEKYAEITVAYARRCMFYANPIQLLIFWMFNCHTKAQSEVSTDDFIWANQIKRAEGDSRGALDAFLPGQQVEEEERNYVLSVIPKKKKLAETNMNVLASIKKDIGLGGPGGFLDNPEHKEYLTRIGWVGWFEKYVMGPRQRGPFDCVGTLDSKIKEIMATTTKEEVVQYLETLVASLPR